MVNKERKKNISSPFNSFCDDDINNNKDNNNLPNSINVRIMLQYSLAKVKKENNGSKLMTRRVRERMEFVNKQN